jgi:hypothetical protein
MSTKGLNIAILVLLLLVIVFGYALFSTIKCTKVEVWSDIWGWSFGITLLLFIGTTLFRVYGFAG